MAVHRTESEERDRPTVKQVYALAAALCVRMGEEFPATRGDASEVIERLRIENGHPQPGLDAAPWASQFRGRTGRRGGRR